MSSSLRKKSLHGLFWDSLGIASQQGIGFIISILLARMLAPKEFGLVGMAMVIINIFQVFTDFGFASALVQNKSNTSKTYSTVFYLNIVFGLFLFIVFQLLAPLIGKFYDNSEIVPLVRSLSLLFIFNAPNIVQQTILRREIDFKTLTIRSVLAQSISGAVGVYLAYQGYGVYSLVIQSLLAAIITTIFLWKVTSWYPRWEFSWDELKKLSGFSIFMFFDQLFSTIVRRFDVLFIGKVFSASTLGFYSRAESFNTLITNYSSKSITKVFFPVLSKVQDDRKRFNQIVYRTSTIISFLSFGLTGLLFILGKDLIVLLFGEKWLPSVWIFQILVLKGFTFPINSMIVNAFLGIGLARENFYIGLFRKAIQFLPIGFGVWLGLKGFIIATVIVSYFLTIVNIIFLSKYLNVHFWHYLVKVFACAVPLIGLIIFQDFFAHFSILQNLSFVLAYALFYLAYCFIIRDAGMLFIIEQLKRIKNQVA